MKFSSVRLGCLLLMLAMGAGIKAAETGPSTFHGPRDGTILVIRHAEKPDAGAELSPEGVQRAEAYVNYFKNLQIDAKAARPDALFAAADSNNSRRPRLTLEPLGKALGLKIDSRYNNKVPVALAKELDGRNHGQCILICWHHGSIPELLQALGGDPAKLLPDAKWPDRRYDWVIALRYDHEGKLIPQDSRRIREELMPGDKK